jgi:hypothetical protein
MTAEP